MKALGVTLAFSCAVALVPATAHAERIGVKEASTACSLDSRASPERERVVAGSSEGDVVARSSSEGEHVDGARLVVALNNEGEDDDATFQRRSGLEHSAQFANHGSAESFADDRSIFGDDNDFDGFGSDLKKQITLALRKHDKKPVDSGKALVPRADAAASPNPEPASMFLIGTGLAGLFRYRRQLFA
jgi:hypothetical protein